MNRDHHQRADLLRPDQRPLSPTSRAMHRVGHWASKAGAGMVVAAILLAWGVVGVWAGFPHWWELILYSTAASLTLVMVFALQHTQTREQLVTQRKLDELLRSQPAADDHLIAAEVASDDELETLAKLNVADRRRAPAGRLAEAERRPDARRTSADDGATSADDVV